MQFLPFWSVLWVDPFPAQVTIWGSRSQEINTILGFEPPKNKAGNALLCKVEHYSLLDLQLRAVIVVLGVITSRIFYAFMCRQFCARTVHDFFLLLLHSFLSHLPSPPCSCNCSCALVCLGLCNHSQTGGKSTWIFLGQTPLSRQESLPVGKLLL